MGILTNASVWASAVRMATPLLLAAFGCMLCAKAGIVNLALEGCMTVGAFLAIVAVDRSGGNVLFGIFVAMIGTAAYSALFALVVVKFKANHIIASIAMNLLGTGLTEFLLAPIFHTEGLYKVRNIRKLAPVHFDFMSRIPILRSFINNQSIIVLITIALIFVMLYVMRKTEYGLKVISIGQNEGSAVTAGINADRIKWSAILICGLFCGLAGAFLSTVTLSEFSRGMISGRGFTAYAAVIFGGMHPVGMAFATLLFGLADALSIQISLLNTGIPASIISMIPYIIAIIALVLSSLSTKMHRSGHYLFRRTRKETG